MVFNQRRNTSPLGVNFDECHSTIENCGNDIHRGPGQPDFLCLEYITIPSPKENNLRIEETNLPHTRRLHFVASAK